MELSKHSHLFDDQRCLEQMAAICRAYDQNGKEFNIPAMMASFSCQSIHLFVAEKFFERRGYATQVIESGVVHILIVSQQPASAVLLQKKQEVLKKKFEFLQLDHQSTAERNAIEAEKKAVEEEFGQLPSYFHVWASF